MSRFKTPTLALSLLALCSLSALASVTVNSPINDATVSPQFTLAAVATTCSDQPVTAMGFSLDSSTNTTIVEGTSIDAAVTATTGAHTLHVKAWGNGGSSCVADVSVTVSAAPTGVSVTTPGSSATVTSPFSLAADALACSSQPVAAMGYSIDYGATTIVNATAINTSLTASTGAHTMHVKAWGNAGAACVSDVPITVEPTAVSTTTTTTTTTNMTIGVTVGSPLSNAAVTSPFALNASAPSCSSQPVSSMGYSLDDSTSTAIVQSTSIAASINASDGAHTVHIKAWGDAGSACVTDVAITVVSPTITTTTTTTSNLAVSSPANGASVNSPFTLSASATLCSSQNVVSMGYSFDSGSTTIVSGPSVNTQVPATTGQHTLHVKAWGSSGAACTSDIAVDVIGASSVIPSNAISVSSIQALNTWIAAYDPGTNGSASGSIAVVSSPSLSGSARQLNTTFNDYGGERYHIAFGDDINASNFFYDAWVYLDSAASSIANIEMDMNQVMPNGQTVIFGFQCDGWSGTWDYTENAGTPTNPKAHWVNSSAACNPRNWTRDTWHHIQISYSRDDIGNVSYHSVWFDGVEQQINATAPSAFALGWPPALLTNFQIDGLVSGSNTVYLDKLTVSRW